MFTLFCALLRSFVPFRGHDFALFCTLLRSWALICVFGVQPRLERLRLGTSEIWSSHFSSDLSQVIGLSTLYFPLAKKVHNLRVFRPFS